MISFRRERVLCLGVLVIIASVLGTYKIGALNGDIMMNLTPAFKFKTEVLPTQPQPPSEPRPPSEKPQQVNDESAGIGPFTTIPEGTHVPGFTILNHLYLKDGIFYVLTLNASSFPPRRDILSRPLRLEVQNLDPTDQELQFLQPEESQRVLGDYAMKIGDLSVIIYDPTQFMSHFYHWWGEIILGLWRVLSTLPPPVHTPARFLMPFSDKGAWRDPAGVDGPLMRAAFPHAAIETADFWQDLVELNTTVVFERVMLVNRRAAHLHPYDSKWYKMIAGTMSVTPPLDFWAPIRQSLVQNLLGYVPDVEGSTEEEEMMRPKPKKPVLTYISRQGGGGRKLIEEDHEGLVQALQELEADGVCEFRMPRMEELGLKEQIELAARSTIILGVHGNGLTHQLWMPRSRRSTVIEIFYPEGYIFDYEMLARNMGHRHYGVWNHTFVTYPEGSYHDGVQIKEGFHGTSIPVHGPAVAHLVRERLVEGSP